LSLNYLIRTYPFRDSQVSWATVSLRSYNRINPCSASGI